MPALPYYPSNSIRYREIQYRIGLRRHGMNYYVIKAEMWKLKNKDKLKVYWTRYNRKIQSAEYRHRYYLQNKDRELSRKREYYKKNYQKIMEQRREFYQKNKERIILTRKRTYKDWKFYHRFNVIFHYSDGSMCCKNCGENIMELLTIDHINGGGNKHRKSIANREMYVWLGKNHYPSGYQILCYNCNMVKERVTPERYEEIIRELQKRKLCEKKGEVI